MNIKDFQYVLQSAKVLVKNNATNEEISDFFKKEGVDATPGVIQDFIENIDEIETEVTTLYM